MDSSSKNSLPVFFFLSELSPLAELCPFKGLKVQICNHDISKTITARSFKLGQLMRMMSRSIDENLKKSYSIFFELSPFADLDFGNL